MINKATQLSLEVLFLLALFLALPQITFAYYTNMPASMVIGQTNFTDSSIHLSQNGLRVPDSILIIDNKLIVADQQNDRVLIWNTIPTQSGIGADVVLGQTDFTSDTDNSGGLSASSMLKPSGLASDGQKLMVADRNNNRILIYNTVPTTSFAPADVVIGQQNFSSNAENQGGSVQANTLKRPDGVYCDGHKLYISDSGNNRVLIFNQLPTENNASADIVLGQPDFTSGLANNGGISGSSMSAPHGIVADGNKLVVAEESNNRVLIWKTIPNVNGKAADVVIGQPDFVSNEPNQGEFVKSNAIYVPTGDLTLYNGRLFLGDTFNNRVLIYNSLPTVNNASADIVLGQPDFVSNTADNGGIGANTLEYPSTPYVHNNRLYVLDAENNRILVFDNYDAVSTPGFSVNYPPESAGSNMRLTGNVVLGERSRYMLKSLEVSINNQGFSSVTHSSHRQLSDTQEIHEFYHDFELWAGVLPRDQWTEGDGFTARFKATSYQSKVEIQEVFIFWPLTLTGVITDAPDPTFSFYIPSKNIDYIKNNVARFEIYIGKGDTWTQYLSEVPAELVGQDGKANVSAQSNGIISEAVSFPPGTYEARVKAFDKWGNSFNSNSFSFELTIPLISSGGESFAQDLWFPLQVNKATGIKTGLISSFRPESVKPSYVSSTSTPRLTGVAFAGSLITMTVTDGKNPNESIEFTAVTNPDSSWSLNPILYSDSIVHISAFKSGLSVQLPPFSVRVSPFQ